MKIARSEHVVYRIHNSMTNLLSYYGLVNAKIRASDKDLPVHILKRVSLVNLLMPRVFVYWAMRLKILTKYLPTSFLIWVGRAKFEPDLISDFWLLLILKIRIYWKYFCDKNYFNIVPYYTVHTVYTYYHIFTILT